MPRWLIKLPNGERYQIESERELTPEEINQALGVSQPEPQEAAPEPVEPEKTSAAGAFGRSAAAGVIPAGGSLAGAIAGAKLGAAIPIPHPLVKAGFALGGGLIGAIAGGIGASKGQEAVAEAVAPEATQQFMESLARGQEEHPVASLAGRFASAVPVFTVSPGKALGEIGALAKGGEAARQAAISLAAKTGAGAGIGVVSPLLEGQTPTLAGVAEMAAFPLVFGQPRFLRGAPPLTAKAPPKRETTKTETKSEPVPLTPEQEAVEIARLEKEMGETPEPPAEPIPAPKPPAPPAPEVAAVKPKELLPPFKERPELNEPDVAWTLEERNRYAELNEQARVLREKLEALPKTRKATKEELSIRNELGEVGRQMDNIQGAPGNRYAEKLWKSREVAAPEPTIPPAEKVVRAAVETAAAELPPLPTGRTMWPAVRSKSGKIYIGIDHPEATAKATAAGDTWQSRGYVKQDGSFKSLMELAREAMDAQKDTPPTKVSEPPPPTPSAEIKGTEVPAVVEEKPAVAESPYHAIPPAAPKIVVEAKPAVAETPPTPVEAKPSAPVKQPWEMTKSEWSATIKKEYGRQGFPDLAAKQATDATHAKEVADALKSGKPVPPEVLKDYPDLQKPPPRQKRGNPPHPRRRRRW